MHHVLVARAGVGDDEVGGEVLLFARHFLPLGHRQNEPALLGVAVLHVDHLGFQQAGGAGCGYDNEGRDGEGAFFFAISLNAVQAINHYAWSAWKFDHQIQLPAHRLHIAAHGGQQHIAALFQA